MAGDRDEPLNDRTAARRRRPDCSYRRRGLSRHPARRVHLLEAARPAHRLPVWRGDDQQAGEQHTGAREGHEVRAVHLPRRRLLWLLRQGSHETAHCSVQAHVARPPLLQILPVGEALRGPCGSQGAGEPLFYQSLAQIEMLESQITVCAQSQTSSKPLFSTNAGGEALRMNLRGLTLAAGGCGVFTDGVELVPAPYTCADDTVADYTGAAISMCGPQAQCTTLSTFQSPSNASL
eukprot:3713158-Prymnesium_polylepis.1